MRTPEEVIAAKRDGEELSREDIEMMVSGFVAGDVPDYQMSAWMMAVLLRGMTERETVDLTRAMAYSGATVDLSSIPGRKADKHSTGGVGDKTTIVVAPLVASLGVPVAKMSGRGLGHTGGTIDKLESIPGFQTEMPMERFVSQVACVGCAVISSRADIDPADKKMYALRDVTGTVPSVPLIVSSIISKKIAGGADVIVLDVKVGSGAFMKTLEEAQALARSLAATGEALGRHVECVLTSMDQPLGLAVGNALEVAEAVAVLSGSGPSDVRSVCVELAARMVSGASGRPLDQARGDAERALADGSALQKFREWVAAQGGDQKVAEAPETVLPAAPLMQEVTSDADGFVCAIDAEAVGRAATLLGAGRMKKGDSVDPAAGIVLRSKVGDRVSKGDVVAVLHTSDASAVPEAETRVRSAIRVFDEPPESLSLFVG